MPTHARIISVPITPTAQALAPLEGSPANLFPPAPQTSANLLTVTPQLDETFWLQSLLVPFYARFEPKSPGIETSATITARLRLLLNELPVWGQITSQPATLEGGAPEHWAAQLLFSESLVQPIPVAPQDRLTLTFDSAVSVVWKTRQEGLAAAKVTPTVQTPDTGTIMYTATRG